MKRISHASLLMLVLVLCASTTRAQLANSCWPKFHRDLSNTGQGLYGGTGSDLTWTYLTGGAIRSAPVIGPDGTAYVASDDGRLYAIAGDGSSRWSYYCKCQGSASPVLASDGTIYLGSSDKYLYAIRADGTLKWKRLLSGRIDSSVTLGPDGTIYCGCLDYKFYAINPLDGSQRWVFTAGGAISSSPALGSDGAVYFGCQDGSLYALNSTGSQRWRFSPGSGAFRTSPAIGPDGTLYLGAAGGYFYAVRSNGTQKWRVATGSDVRSSAAVSSNGTIFFGCRDHKLYAVSPLGVVQWTFAASHYVDSSPAVGIDGGVYFGSSDGRLYSLNPDGTERWRYDVGAPITSSPAIGPAGALFLGADNGSLYCFAADDTPPEAPVVADDGAFTSQLDRMHGTWSAADPESGVFSYEYCIGTAPGLDNVAPWLNVGSATQHTRTGLALVDGQVYYITARAINGAGLRGPESSSDGIVADATPPLAPSVIDGGRFTSNATTLEASWSATDPESGVVGYQYSIGTTAGSSNVVPWTDVGAATSIVRSGLSLQGGVTYYINVKALNSGGAWGPLGSSDGITVDVTAPSVPVVTDAGQFTSNPSSIWASWSTADNESGVSKFEYSVGTTAGGTQVLGWTDAGALPQMTITGLTLTNGGTYFVNVRATNGALLVSPVGSSDGITLDTTAPTTPVVTDDGDFTASTSQIHATWTASDPESGIQLYKYAIGTSPGATNIVPWTDNGTATSVTRTGLSLVDKQTYYLSVIATNGAQAESAVGTSNGITVDATPPTRPTVVDDGEYTASATELHAVWSASDPQSGIVLYEYSIGTLAGAADTLGWTPADTSTEATITGLSLQGGVRYYINVRATNGAGTRSEVGSTDGIYVESTPPTTPVVTDDGQFTQSTTTISATWTSEDPETGVAKYEYCIGTQPALGDLVPWTDAATQTGVRRTDLTLTQGTTYYVSVRATNGIGLVSEVGSSDGITVDTTAPEIPIVTGSAYSSSTTELHITLECVDAESGIASYDCAVGTAAGSTDVADWANVGTGPDVTLTGLSLRHGNRYYVSARATNGAGIVGEPGTSGAITVDTTGPVNVSVRDDGAFTASDTQLHGRWSASDPESGIGSFRYCIGTAAGANDVADWLDVGTATEHTRTGLALVSGTTYYITVIAVNRAGAQSGPVSSDGIRLDLSPPVTPVVTDSGQYWGYKTSIFASWESSDPESGVAEYSMSVGTAAGATDVADWMSVGSRTSYTRTGLRLEDGITYYINIRARNGAGIWSAAGSSDGAMIDSTPPTTPVVTDDGDTQALLDRVHATWHSSDPESGIMEYVYCVGTSPGATDVVPWTSAGLVTDVTVTGIELDPVLRYYVSVKARSGAGAWSAVSASDGIGYSNGAAIWSRFRNDPANLGRSLFSATRVSDVGWTVATQGYVESSPAIAADGTTYIGSGDGKIYAITQNGTIRWTYNTGSPVDSSPAIAPNKNVLVGCDNGAVLCLSPVGELIWSYTTGGPVRSSALIVDGSVYVGSMDGSLYALDLASGAKLWQYATGGSIRSSAAAGTDGSIYFAAGDGYLYALNPAGTLKWRFRTGSAADTSPALGSDGTVYFGSGDGYFYAIAPDGSMKWRFSTGSVADSSTAISPDGTLYFGAGMDGGNGALYALRPNGTLIWRVNLPGGGIVSSPAIDRAGTIYVGACNHRMYAYNPDGTVCWSFLTGSSVVSSPAVGADSSVVFGSYDGSIYCLRDITSKDLTPPTTPIVTVPGSSVAIGQPLTASWSATDPESMVAEYTYAVGTEPGAADITGWVSAGIETSMSRDDLVLEEGRTYYVSVKARNPSQRWSDVGTSAGVTVLPAGPVGSIADLKSRAIGFPTTISDKVVTAVFSDCFFVEEPTRIAGIRCVGAGADLRPGDRVGVTGALALVNGEIVLAGATHTGATIGEPLKPLGIGGHALSIGKPDPLGLSVVVCGPVTAVGTDYVVVDIGSGLYSPRGASGLEVRCDTTGIAVGDCVRAVGVLCREISGGTTATVLRTAGNGAVAVVAP
jgi:outer membrane protein assembly factor BamB